MKIHVLRSGLRAIALACAFVFGVTVTPGRAQLVYVDSKFIGNPNNTANTGGLGAVSYTYYMSTYEVTVSQYATFLNAVATLSGNVYITSLYNSNMDTESNRLIQRSGSGTAETPYSYTVLNSNGQKPITYVDWFSAARFANWMNNGALASSSTETGAYTLNGATTGNTFTTQGGATWWIPSENEWYKAAYYKGGSTTAGYYLYPTSSDSTPGSTVGSQSNQANFSNGMQSINQTTPVGSFTGSASPYGTFDMGGNVYEWTSQPVNAADYEIYGGAWNVLAGSMQNTNFGEPPSTTYANNIGFRLATSIPEPSVLVMVIPSVLFGALWLRRMKSRRLNNAGA